MKVVNKGFQTRVLKSSMLCPADNNPSKSDTHSFIYNTYFCEQAQLPISYLRKDHIEGWRHDVLVPFEERSDSPVYVQSNCMPQFKRDNIVRNLMKFPDLNIRSFGRCGWLIAQTLGVQVLTRS